MNTDRNISAYLASTEAAAAERIIALLVTVKRERNVLGIELEGEVLSPRGSVRAADGKRQSVVICL